MMQDRPEIWFLREAQPNDPYEHIFTAAGFATRTFPVLSFEEVNAVPLREALSRPDRFGGLIITSPRTAEIVCNALRSTESLSRWQSHMVFAVGPRTAAILVEAGFDPVGEESGTGLRLASVILRRYRSELPLLFPAGDRRRPELPARLYESKVDYEELTVYRTLGNGSFPESHQPDWLAFFSPSGVEAQARSGFPARAKIAAIGETTAGALRRAGVSVDAVAIDPSPDSLYAAITNAERL